ncbi:AraC family transcriptional regulator [Terrimonas sp.]|nr:AraC family transcriptional regulator [Terrimonas sp.]
MLNKKDRILADIPTYSICNLHDNDTDDVVVVSLKPYLLSARSVVFPHRHSFYQVLYITHGGGRHIIDFETYPVNKGVVYFLSPGQIHEWDFDENTDGILINFSASFFSTFLANSNYLNDFLFFSSNGKHSVISFNAEEGIEHIFRQMLDEYALCKENYTDIIRALLLTLFVLANRKIEAGNKHKDPYLFRQLLTFEKLVDQHFMKKRLPKEYAELMFITPNYLNAICNKLTGRSAGEFIRQRILLEAKRLLVNSAFSVSEIAWQLNFDNNSYFSRFFKKYEHISPEDFKKKK